MLPLETPLVCWTDSNLSLSVALGTVVRSEGKTMVVALTGIINEIVGGQIMTGGVVSLTVICTIHCAVSDPSLASNKRSDVPRGKEEPELRRRLSFCLTVALVVEAVGSTKATVEVLDPKGAFASPLGQLTLRGHCLLVEYATSGAVQVAASKVSIQELVMVVPLLAHQLQVARFVQASHDDKAPHKGGSESKEAKISSLAFSVVRSLLPLEPGPPPPLPGPTDGFFFFFLFVPFFLLADGNLLFMFQDVILDPHTGCGEKGVISKCNIKLSREKRETKGKKVIRLKHAVWRGEGKGKKVQIWYRVAWGSSLVFVPL
jgi:hypothetical protein